MIRTTPPTSALAVSARRAAIYIASRASPSLLHDGAHVLRDESGADTSTSTRERSSAPRRIRTRALSSARILAAGLPSCSAASTASRSIIHTILITACFPADAAQGRCSSGPYHCLQSRSIVLRRPAGRVRHRHQRHAGDLYKSPRVCAGAHQHDVAANAPASELGGRTRSPRTDPETVCFTIVTCSRHAVRCRASSSAEQAPRRGAAPGGSSGPRSLAEFAPATGSSSAADRAGALFSSSPTFRPLLRCDRLQGLRPGRRLRARGFEADLVAVGADARLRSHVRHRLAVDAVRRSDGRSPRPDARTGRPVTAERASVATKGWGARLLALQAPTACRPAGRCRRIERIRPRAGAPATVRARSSATGPRHRARP